MSIDAQSRQPSSIHLLVRWISQTKAVKTVTRFKALWGLFAAFSLAAYSCFTYFASADSVRSIECALEHQRNLAIKRDEALSISRQIASSREQEILTMDFMLLVKADSGDSVEIGSLKTNIYSHLSEKLKLVRGLQHGMVKEQLKVLREVDRIDRDFTVKKCLE